MVGDSVTVQTSLLVSSLLDWWALAGLDAAVADAPRNWLEKPRPAARSAMPAPAATAARVSRPTPGPAATSPPLPDSLDAFLEWLATSLDQPEASYGRGRILPGALAGAPLMVVTDMPTAEDMKAGQLFAGEDGALLDAMLRAIGLDRTSTALASLHLTRPPAGIVDDAQLPALTARLSHYIGLARPECILFMGDRTSRALIPTDAGQGDKNLRFVNHQGLTIPAMRIAAPLVLLRYPDRKAAAWAALRQLGARP